MLTLGVLVLARNVSRVTTAFFVMTLTASVWLFCFAFMYSTTDAATALFWAKAAYLGVPLIAPAVYQFTVEHLRIAQKRRAAIWFAWIASAFFAIIAIGTDRLVTGVAKFWWGFYPQYGLISIPYLAVFFGYLIAAMIELAVAYRRTSGAEAQRLRLMLIGFGIAYLGCVDYLAKYGIAVYPFGYIPLLAFLAILSQIIRKYDLVTITPSFAAREIIHTMADALLVCNNEWRIELANEAAEALLGYESGELVGLPITTVLADEKTNPRVSQRFHERIFVSRDGERIEVTLSVTPLVHQGVTAGAVLIARDLRERKRTDRDLRKAVSLLQSTLESTADGIVVIGDDGTIISYNRRFVDMWRIPIETIRRGDDKAVLHCVLEQLTDPAEFTVNTLAANPEAESFDVLNVKDGRRFERYSIGRRISGVADVRVWSFRDVTERYHNETALRESEARFRLLFEQNAAGVYRAELGGRILDCNDTFARMVGCSPATLIGRNTGDLYARPIEREELALILQQAGTLQSVEVELQNAEGKSVWVLQNLVLLGEGESSVIHATVVDISDRKRAEEQIEFHAYHDVLTGLPNRKLFTDRLNWSISRCRRSSRALAVMFLDLDHFKSINDSLGHTAGDELLLEMARRLKMCVREDDTVARLGGDEFTIVLSDLRESGDAIVVAQKILTSIQQPVILGGMTVDMTVSIGIALYPEDGIDAESLLKNADSALYRAKDAGRNAYQLCTNELKEKALQQISLERALRRALAEGELTLYYQPVVSLASGAVVGAEALLRWIDPTRGVIMPGEFIPFAEDSRLIVPIGEWVLHSACKQMRMWHDRGVGPVRVAVNLSARQFQHHDLVNTVRAVLRDTRLDPSCLDLEVTETTAMHNAEVTIEVVEALRALGVSISIDDFGTGYSSLNYLKRFPINAVKIDRSFVQELATSEEDAAIVSAVVGIAHSLRLRVIAEGVETHEQLSMLIRKRCDEVQGFLFGRPMPADSLTDFMSVSTRIPVRSRILST
jgi:diguanylate cyclase (GGDEF)-like protein/PAS domain S-box-containing protein